jgi:hypothetical protein
MLGVVVVLALVATGAVLWHQRDQGAVPDSVLEQSSRLGPNIWCAPSDLSRCHDRTGSGTRVLVVGDSQVQMLVPMLRKLADDHDWDLWFDHLAGCPWQEGLVNRKQAADTAEQCTEARVGWYRRALPRIDPDVVIMMERPRDDPRLWEGVLARRDGRDQPVDAAVRDTTRHTLNEVARQVPHVLVVGRLTMPETFLPRQCLAKADSVGECTAARPTSPSLSDQLDARLAAHQPRVQPVDLDPAFCVGSDGCLPVVGGLLVYADDHHYTSAYAASRTEEVWRILRATGAF